MKHLKYFEKKKFKYNVDDYIKLIQDEDTPWYVSLICKIIDFDSRTKNIDYYIETYLLSNKKIENFWVDEYEVERFANESEIEQFNSDIQSNKYNL